MNNATHDQKIETLILRYIKQGILKKRPVRAENVIAYVLKTYKRATKAEVAKIYHELKFTPTFVNARD